jgi:hypothetical protein
VLNYSFPFQAKWRKWRNGAKATPSRSSRVILIGIRLKCQDISRWLKFLVLGHADSDSPNAGGWPKRNDQQLATLPSDNYAMKPRYLTVYQEYIKVSMDKYLIGFLSLSTRDMQSRIQPGSRFTQKHERIGSQYKSKTSNIIVTWFYTISCYYTGWRPLHSSSSSLRAPTSVYCPDSQYPDRSFLQVAHWLSLVTCGGRRRRLHDGQHALGLDYDDTLEEIKIQSMQDR